MKRAIILFAVLTCSPPSSFGQSPVRLSLADAIARGFANSHRLAEARAREDGAKAAATSADLADKPIVGASAGFVHLASSQVVVTTTRREPLEVAS